MTSVNWGKWGENKRHVLLRDYISQHALPFCDAFKQRRGEFGPHEN